MWDIHWRVGEHIGKYDTLLERKLRLFGHVVTRLRAKGTPSCRVQFSGKIKRKACRWLNDVKKWTGLSSNEMWREHAESRVPDSTLLPRSIREVLLYCCDQQSYCVTMYTVTVSYAGPIQHKNYLTKTRR